MNELLLRTAAPALVLVVEVEGPTRVVSTANGPADEERLEAWIAASTARERAVRWALLDRTASGGAERQRRWASALAADGGGIVAAAQDLLRELHLAEERAREHHAGGRTIERLRRLLRSSATRV